MVAFLFQANRFAVPLCFGGENGGRSVFEIDYRDYVHTYRYIHACGVGIHSKLYSVPLKFALSGPIS